MSAKDIEIQEAYGDYRSLIDYRALVSRMLDVVPEVYLERLESIQLRAGQIGNRKDRRAKTKSRGKNVNLRKALGLYQHPGSKGASVILHVDALDEYYGSITRLPYLRRLICETSAARTFFHEIGHHIHVTKHPQHRERENVAEEYAAYYGSKFLRRDRPIFTVVLRFVFIPTSRIWKKFRPNSRRTKHRSRGANKRLAALEVEAIAAFEQRQGKFTTGGRG